MNHENYRKLANQLMFDLNEEEIKHVEAEFSVLHKQIELLDGIDTTGVEEMIYPFSAPTSFLREDVVAQTLSSEAVLANAKKVKEGHIHVPKVVRS